MLKRLKLVFFPADKATFKGWMDIMYAAVDSRAVSVKQIPFLKNNAKRISIHS